MNREKREQFVKDALVEMFRCAGRDVTYEDIKQLAKNDPNWYHNNTWTKEQEAEFKEWWMSNLKMSRVKKENEFAWFNLMFGFRRTDH